MSQRDRITACFSIRDALLSYNRGPAGVRLLPCPVILDDDRDGVGACLKEVQHFHAQSMPEKLKGDHSLQMEK